MFLEFLGADDQNLWNVEWLSTDKGFSTINTFISEKLKEQIRNFYSENDTIASFYKLAI